MESSPQMKNITDWQILYLGIFQGIFLPSVIIFCHWYHFSVAFTFSATSIITGISDRRPRFRFNLSFQEISSETFYHFYTHNRCWTNSFLLVLHNFLCETLSKSWKSFVKLMDAVNKSIYTHTYISR